MNFEITGFNWNTRLTNADAIINKYFLINACMDMDVKTESYQLAKKSYQEDTSDVSMFNSASFDQDDSPYT